MNACMRNIKEDQEVGGGVGMMVHVECEMLMKWSDKDELKMFTPVGLEVKTEIWAKGGFPGGSDGKERLQCRRPGFSPWVRKIPWRRKWQPTPVFSPGQSHGQRGLTGYLVHGVTKGMDVGNIHVQKKEMEDQRNHGQILGSIHC